MTTQNATEVEQMPDSQINCETIADASLPKVHRTCVWRRLWQDAAQSGLLKQFMPKVLGGDGATAQDFVREMIGFGEASVDNGISMGLNSQVWTIQQLLVAFATTAQKETYLPDLMSGQTVGAFALTEPDAGSDALAMKTRAVFRDDGYVLNGAKTLVGMGPVCDLAIVFASTAPENANWGISAFIVTRDDVGFVRKPAQEKMGLKTLPMGPLGFDECWIPADRLIGNEGSGARIIQTTLDWERSFILAPHVGAMARQMAACVAYCQERQVFGQKIKEFQSVSNRLADMRVRLETSKLMLERAAFLYDTNQPLTQHAAMTNLHVSEAFLASSLDALRNFGGAGFLNDAVASLDLRDAVGGVIYSGTSDLQRQIIATLEAQQRRPT